MTLQSHDTSNTSRSKNDQYEPAPPVFQYLGKEAQATVGVENILPIMIATKSTDMDSNNLANASSKRILVNPNLLKRSYGYARCILFHEAIHAKYQDPRKNGAFHITGNIITNAGSLCIFTGCKITKLKNKYCCLLTLATWGTLKWIYKRLESQKHFFQERRADTEGLRATKCELCVKESALYSEIGNLQEEAMHNPPKDIFTYGYLDHHAKYAIADELKGQMCIFHSIPQNADQSNTWFNNSKNEIKKAKIAEQ